MGDISKNFSYSEFKVSNNYPELAAKIELTTLDRYKIFWMVQIFLQPVRDLLNLEVFVGSAKRSTELNNKVGGTGDSDHLFRGFSCAVDFKLRKLKAPKDDWEQIGNYWSLIHRLFWGKRTCTNQLIWYYPSAGNFIHFSLADGGKPWQVLYCVSRGGRVYFDNQVDANKYIR
jgi:hypothetical protein